MKVSETWRDRRTLFLMRNANIFVDVDLTLIDSSKDLLPGAREALAGLRAKGWHFYVWSEYARQIAGLYQLAGLFAGFSAKPDIIIDDMPGTVLKSVVFDVNAEISWTALADKIVHKHID